MHLFSHPIALRPHFESIRCIFAIIFNVRGKTEKLGVFLQLFEKNSFLPSLFPQLATHMTDLWIKKEAQPGSLSGTDLFLSLHRTDDETHYDVRYQMITDRDPVQP